MLPISGSAIAAPTATSSEPESSPEEVISIASSAEEGSKVRNPVMEAFVVRGRSVIVVDDAGFAVDAAV